MIMQQKSETESQLTRNQKCPARIITTAIRLIMMTMLPILLLIGQFATGSEALLLQVPNRHTVASIPGELVLGILVPVHERPSPKQAQTRTCGAVREQYGIQRVEAAFKTIDSINADRNILPNITLGIEIRDSCWHSPIALEQSIEFIRDAMAASEQSQSRPQQQQQQQQLASSTTTTTIMPLLPEQNTSTAAICAPLLRQQQQQQQQQQQLKKVKNIVGVVGPASSTDTVQVQNLLQLFNMPQVGYSATSRDLSNKNFFKYFLRVVPSDKLQAQVMIDLMLAYNWTYVTVAYTEGSYGSSLMNAFRERAQEVGICFATLESMPPNADDSKFDELIEAIQKHPNARVVICMCEGRTTGKLFSALKRKNIINEYLVVGSDGWSDRFDVVEKHEEFALGGISIRIHSAYVEDFDDYYFALNPFTNHRNPWFAEFWETRFQCNLEQMGPASNHSISSSSSSQQRHSNNLQQRPFVRPPGSKIYNRTCTGRESLRNNHKQDAKMAFVQKSIITMALGLDSMQRAICPAGKLGLCPEMLPVNGSILLQHLMNVSFSFLNEEVHFDEQGDPPGKYEILNFQRSRRPPQGNYSSNSPSPSLSSGWPDGGSSSSGGPEMIDSAPSDLLTTVPGQTSPHVVGSSQNYNNNNNNSMDAADIQQSDIERKRLMNPLYDSYSTLKVYRRKSADSLESRLKRRRRQLLDEQLRRSQQDQQQQQHPPASGYSSTSGYEYVHVGSWKSSDGLSIFGNIHWPRRSSGDTFQFDELGASSVGGHYPQMSMNSVPNSIPKSVCSLPCARGHAKKIQSDSVKCCWVCVACRPHEYLFDEFKCKACEKGWWPNALQTGCDQIPIQHLDWRSMEALTAISIASTGLILTLATGIVFIKHNNTPVVKSSTRELSYMILFAMLLSYLETYLLVAKPQKLTCLLSRILPGFAFAMMYGALVTKTNRIARILAGSKKKIITRRPRFMSGTSQVAITWIIVLIECVIVVFMLVREPADKTHEYPSADRVLLVCNTTTMGIIAPLGFDFFLILMCTLYAFKTRNVPENFNEAKFIGFTMYTTLVIWIAFVVIYLSSEHRVTTLSLCISFSSLFALFLLFFPRCYIIIFKPAKNNRSFFTTTKNVRCHIGYQIASNPPSSTANAGLAASTNQQQIFLPSSQTGNGPAAAAGTGASGNSPAALATGPAYQAPLAAVALQQPTDNSYSFLQPISSPTTTATLPDDSQQLQVNGQPQARVRTSALQWHNYHHHHHQQQQYNEMGSGATSGGGGGPKTHNRKQQQHPAREQMKRSQSWLMPANYTSSVAMAGGDQQLERGNIAPTGGSYLEQEQQIDTVCGEPGGGNGNGNANLDRQAGGRGSSFLCSLVWASCALLGWRARRKESDKASSIQQHLRAIRHAENLDRQTHFRRSQVQRLVQRFDSTGTQFIECCNQQQQQQLRQQTSSATTGNLSSMEVADQERDGGSSGAAIASSSRSSGEVAIGWPSGEDAERLLAVLGQLIGGRNVWRLVDTLRRHTQNGGGPSSQMTTGTMASASSTTIAHPRSPELILAAPSRDNRCHPLHEEPSHQDLSGPSISSSSQTDRRQLDLRKLSDRRLALALLKFLTELAREAIEEIQIGNPAVSIASAAWPAESRASQGQRMEEDEDNCPRFELEIARPNDCNRALLDPCKTKLNGNNRPLPESLSQRHWSRHQQQQQHRVDKPLTITERDNSLSRQRQKDDDDNQGSRSFVDWSNSGQQMMAACDKDESDVEENDEDPIKRTLECIMGTKGRPSSSGGNDDNSNPCLARKIAGGQTARKVKKGSSHQHGTTLEIKQTNGKRRGQAGGTCNEDDSTTNLLASNTSGSSSTNARHEPCMVAETTSQNQENNNPHPALVTCHTTGLECSSPGRLVTRPVTKGSTVGHTSQQSRQSAAELETQAFAQAGQNRHSPSSNVRQEVIQQQQQQSSASQVIGQSINGGGNVGATTKTNHSRSLATSRSGAATAGWRCCCECSARRSRSRCYCSAGSKSTVVNSSSPGCQQQEKPNGGGGGGESAVSSCCCCSRSAACSRTGRRRHRARSSSGSRGGTKESTSSSIQTGKRPQSSPSVEATAYKYLSLNKPKSINQQQQQQLEDSELVEDKL